MRENGQVDPVDKKTLKTFREPKDAELPSVRSYSYHCYFTVKKRQLQVA